MGIAQSQQAFFPDANQVNGRQVDVYRYLYEVEKTLWRTEVPWWTTPNNTTTTLYNGAASGHAIQADIAIRKETPDIHPTMKLSMKEALTIVPQMLTNAWISPLVTLIESADEIVQRVSLALLSKLIGSDADEDIFIKVGGMEKLFKLLRDESTTVQYLVLQVIHSLCARSPTIVLQFCKLGLVAHLTSFAKCDSIELILASLKILRITLSQPAVKAEMDSCQMLTILMQLVDSPNTAIARAAVVCIGLSLPNAANLAEMLRLGCVDVFLKLMTPSNPNADAIIYALSLIADEAESIFPRDLTLLMTSRMLETLRGAAKRSANASTMGFLFSSLAKSSTFQSALCSENNLAILSKLLVGGSTQVLCATAYTLGTIALHSQHDSIKEILFTVDAPQNLMRLVLTSDEQVSRLGIFALAALVDERLLLSGGKHFHPEPVVPSTLQEKMANLCDSIIATNTHHPIFNRAIHNHGPGSTYAMKILTAMSGDEHVRTLMWNAECIQQMLWYTHNASASFLATCLLYFLECSNATSDATKVAQETTEGNQDQTVTTRTSAEFCTLVENTQNGLEMLIELFDHHKPEHLFGLPKLLTNFVIASPSLKAKLSTSLIINQVLNLITRLNHPVLHDQVLRFLDELTKSKHQSAIQLLFNHDPDRVANLLYSSHHHLQIQAATLLRRMFKRLNAPEIPSLGAKRQLVKLLACDERRVIAIGACRVLGNLFQYEDKRVSFAQNIPDAIGLLFTLLLSCTSTDLDTTQPESVKQLFVTIRTIHRASVCEEIKQVMVTAPHFLVIAELVNHVNESVMDLAVATMGEVARGCGLRKHFANATVLNAVLTSLRNQDSSKSPAYKIKCLQFVGILAKKEPQLQHLLIEYKILDALLLLLHSTLTSLNWEVLNACLETLAWMCSGSDSPVRRTIVNSKLVDLTLKHVDSACEQVTCSSLHFLQRLSSDEQVKEFVHITNGATVIMRALTTKDNCETKRRACGLVRNLVTQHESNRSQFQQVGTASYLVKLIVTCKSVPDESTRRLQIKGLQAIAALCEGLSASAKACKQDIIESDHSSALVRLVDSQSDMRLVAAWCFAWAMVTMGSSSNQKRLVDTDGIVPLLVQYLKLKDYGQAQINAARLLAYLASMPDNRSPIMKQGSDELLAGIINALRSELYDVQRFAALLVGNLVTRNDENKVKLGASGAVSPLIDRLSSKQIDVLENVLHAVTKLGSHAGNKVKFGCKICFEKLLAIVHHDELAIRKSAVSAIAVLIEGNEANKKYLLQCEASVVTELCALMKSNNGKVVESAMLILGELSLLPDQTLEISKYIDILVIVRMIEHVNIKIKRAALNTVLNLTKESFNKLRFGNKECIDALLASLLSDELTIVELAVTCLANLSFTPANAARIVHSDSLMLLLKLAAASTTLRDSLSWKETHFLKLGKNDSVTADEPRKPERTLDSSKKEVEASDDDTERNHDNDPAIYSYRDGDNDGERQEVLDFSSFPSRQTVVLEETMLILSNCAEEYHSGKLVEKVAIKVVCQALYHPSELVKRCACFILASWCKKDPVNQEITTKRNVLPVLVQLLNSPNPNIIEASMYVLGKLCYFGDNHLKLLNLDLLNTLVNGILRRSAAFTHEGQLDRALRVLGTLVHFPKVRQVVKSEEIISDILTNLLQIHRKGLAKNISRLILVMLEEESLKFFLPKKTVMLLRAISTDDTTDPKTIRNIFKIFELITVVEEHKTTIALEDSGEALGRMVDELNAKPEMNENTESISWCGLNAPTVLRILAGITSTRKIAIILYEKDLLAVLPRYLTPYEFPQVEHSATTGCKMDLVEARPTESSLANSQAYQDHVEINLHALRVAKQLCTILLDKAINSISILDFSRVIINLLRSQILDNNLSELSCECLFLLAMLCPKPHDEQILLQEDAIQVLLSYLEIWIRVVLGDMASESNGCKDVQSPYINRRQDDPAVDPLVFIRPWAKIVQTMANQKDNSCQLVCHGSIPLLLKVMAVSILTDDLLEQLAVAVSLLSALQVAKKCFDSQDLLSPLIKFMLAHQANPQLVLSSLQTLTCILKQSKKSRVHILSHLGALPFLLRCLADFQSDQVNKVRFAIVALQCLSMEQDIADQLAHCDAVRLVPELLLISNDRLGRDVQYNVTEMIGYMAFFGHADKLMLNDSMITKIVTFAAYGKEEMVTTKSISLSMWVLLHLVKSTLSATICKWIVDDPLGLDVLIQCGLRSPKELEISSSVVANVLTILIKIIDVQDVVRILVNKHICTPLSHLLEAVEQEVRVSALRILALLLPSYACLSGDKSADESHNAYAEEWTLILRHLIEWMEVYARELPLCSISWLLDAYSCLHFLTALPDLAVDFQLRVVRTGLIEIVGNTLLHFTGQDPHDGSGLLVIRDQDNKSISLTHAADESDKEVKTKVLDILYHALWVCHDLMLYSPSYSSKLIILGAPMAVENIILLPNDRLLLPSLNCMNHLANLSVDHNLLFSSQRCVSRLIELLTLETPAIVANVTPLLALMTSRMPTLPTLCTQNGIKIVSDRVMVDWSARDESQMRITDDACHILVSAFSADDNVTTIYDQADVIGKMFKIVEAYDKPVLPLQLLVKMSTCLSYIPRFIELLNPLCDLLSGETASLGTESNNLVLMVLSNIFCKEVLLTLPDGLPQKSSTMLRQLLPLSRWVDVSYANSIHMALKLLHRCLQFHEYKTVLNDGANIPSILALINHASEDVAIAAAQVLLTAAGERDVQISITVEDGIASIVKTLRRTNQWELQCLILTILRTMCDDSEIQVLIINEQGAERMVQFVKERKETTFSRDERLALSCDILLQLSKASSGPTNIIEADGHLHMIEFDALHFDNESDKQHDCTTEILVNLAKCSSVTNPLVTAKLHEHLWKYFARRTGDGSEWDLTRSQQLALSGLRALSKASKDVRYDLSTKEGVVVLLEQLLKCSDSMVVCDAMLLLYFISKCCQHRKAIFTQSSINFIQLVCNSILVQLSITRTSYPRQDTSEDAICTEAVCGIKLLANLLGDTTEEHCPISWHCEGLTAISYILGKMLSNHQRSNQQLIALQVLSGSFSRFYFPLSPQMLGDLLNILLISQSNQHCVQAERVIVNAFQDSERIYSSIGGNQILEQLLIIFTQKTCRTERRSLSPALTHVVYVSISRKFIVNERFLTKLMLLLGADFSLESVNSVDNVTKLDPAEQALQKALCVYLGFVYRSTMDASLKQKIREALRADSNAGAFAAILNEIRRCHSQICPHEQPVTTLTVASTSGSVIPAAHDQAATIDSHGMLLWNFLADIISPLTPHVESLLHMHLLKMWLCLIDDWFLHMENFNTSEGTVVDSKSFRIDGRDEKISLLSNPCELVVNTCRILSAITQLKPRLDEDPLESYQQDTLCQRCVSTLWSHFNHKLDSTQLVEATLQALMDARNGWGEGCVISGCTSFSKMELLLPELLKCFRDPAQSWNRSRHMLLQLLLLLVSTGNFIEVLKTGGIRAAIENNEFISVEDKAIPITILSLLGYNADLNKEFKLALDKLENASTAAHRQEILLSLVNFLRLYALTDETLQGRAINCFMTQLVALSTSSESNANATSMASDCVDILRRLSGVRKFVELYLKSWDLNALLSIIFARKRGDETNGFSPQPCFSISEVEQLMGIIAQIRGRLGAAIDAEQIDEACLYNALVLVDCHLGPKQVQLTEQVLSLIHWLMGNKQVFDWLSTHASMLCTFFRFIPDYSDSCAQLLDIVENVVRGVNNIDCLNELLSCILNYVYSNPITLSKAVRDKLLLHVLIIMKRMGEDGLSGSTAYEHSMRMILLNVQSPSDLVAGSSWDLLGMLTEFDPAITAIFNLDGVKVLLREFGAVSVGDQQRPPSANGPSRSSPSSSMYRRMEALKCLSKAAKSHDEVLLVISTTPGIAGLLFQALGSDQDLRHSHKHTDSGNSQGHAAHLIARIASQDELRASLLSQEHITALIESLESVHPTVVLYALEGLYYMCEFSLCLDALVHHATVPVLAQIVSSPLAEGIKQEHTEEYVLRLLGSMCSNSKRICRRVVSSNLVPKLKSFVSSSKESLQQNAAWTIKSLSKDSELVPKLNDHHILETLSEHLLDYNPQAAQRKALGAMRYLLASLPYPPESIIAFATSQTVEALNINIPNPAATRTVANALMVLESIATIPECAKTLLFEYNAIQTTLGLFGSTDRKVRLKALHVAKKWVEDNSDVEKIRELFIFEAPLLNLIRVISDESNDILLAALSLLNILLTDDKLKEKLTPMTYEVALQHISSYCNVIVSSTPISSKILIEALRSLVAMTKAGQVSNYSSSAIAKSIDPLLQLLNHAPSDGFRMNSLYLLVNFASSVELRAQMLNHGAMQIFINLLQTKHEEKISHLCLLGIALFTADNFVDAKADLMGILDTILDLLRSKNAGIQANAVWVLSNISSEEDLKDAIISRGGATTLQTLLNDNTSSDDSNASSRPTSSSARIREYAPKAIKSLGYDPLVRSLPPAPHSSQT